MSEDILKPKPDLDIRFNLPSYGQYLKDLKEKKFSKMCMTQVVNADMMIASFGEESFYESSTEILQMGNAAYKMMGIDGIIHVYIYNYRSFIAVANDDISDDDFLNLMRVNYEQYELATSAQTGKGGVSRFVITFGEDLINRALSTFYLNKDSQENFIVSTNEQELIQAQNKKEAEIFELLSYAIQNNKVIPYYQGIYSNDLKEITKYEALMRICDKDGKICPPGLFLDMAKSLKLYLPISKILIDTALSDFEKLDYNLGLNVSLLDIQSEDFKLWFFERLKNFPEPSRVVIEFLETENYGENMELINFLNEVKKIGCKVAIDDFGAGFATYTAIIACKPDIIKIDGSIIKELDTNEDSRLILASICYMAKLIGAEITAEFVENEDIQSVISENNINFSQGYYFAKPEPFSNLGI